MTTTRIQLRRDTAANWVSANPILSSGEFGVEVDTGRFKAGNGAANWAALAYQGVYALIGTRASPQTVTASVSIPIAGLPRELHIIRSLSGDVVMTANPQIQAGTTLGQELVLQYTGAGSVEIANGTGLELNGPCVFVNCARMYLVWDGTVWGEVARNDA